MQKKPPIPTFWIIVATLSLVILVIYTYTYFFVVPYLGLNIQLTTGEVDSVSGDNRGDEFLQIGDVVISAGSLTRQEIIGNRDRIRPVFNEYKQGDVIQFQVDRKGNILQVQWIVPGPSIREVWFRVFDLWWMAYVFWGFGLLTLLSVYIRDDRWKLLLWLYFLSAIWIIAGVLSRSFILYSSLVIHSTTWLLVAVMLHLHLILPKPFQFFQRHKSAFLIVLYTICIALSVAELFQLLPWGAFFSGVVIAFVGSLVLLFAHYKAQPETHWAVKLVVASITIVGAGGIFFIILDRTTGLSGMFGGGILFAPLIPAAYFYITMRRRVGNLEEGLNRFIITLVFSVFLLSVNLAVVGLISLIIPDDATRLIVGIGAVVIVGTVFSFFYGSFRQTVEKQFLGIQQSVDELVQSYGQRLVTRLSVEQLVNMLRDDVMPGLRIRQAALILLHGIDKKNASAEVEVLCSVNVEPDDIPLPEYIKHLLDQAGRYRTPPDEGVVVWPCTWVRLVLPMKHEGQIIGVCLMGDRDPDNFYSQSEIPVLQALVDQTSLALVNIEQSELLLRLSRRSIAHREAERQNLAHELHDEVLAQMAVLAQSMSEPSDAFIQAYQDAVQRIRDVISGLRPATLEQLGLHTALEELLDDLTERSELMSDVEPILELDLNPERLRYDRDVELHIYRIVQQACYNVLEHANAHHLIIRGMFTPDSIAMEVIDDGDGFLNGNRPDLVELLARKHYGLVTMHERADLIGAHVQIESAINVGTNVKIDWQREPSGN